MSQAFLLRWGILGAGHISGCFVRDAILDPSTRDVHDVSHRVVAVGSRDVTKAQQFIDKNARGVDYKIKAYGTYEEVVRDQDVDAVYIGTPHTHHYTCAVLALNAGKHVLCEKPFTTNEPELLALIKLAKEKKLFLMEAMWTRFLPTVLAISKIIAEESLGEIRVLHADLSGDFHLADIPKTHRILDPHLGGGGLLDLGPYPYVWAVIALFESPKNQNSPPSKVTSTMIKTPLTGVDSATVFVLDFDKINAQAILSTNIELTTPTPAATLRFRNGNILIPHPIFKPTYFTLQKFDKPGSKNVVFEETRHFEWVGGGWHFQADEVAKGIRDGKLESSIWTLEKSVLQMKIFDLVRKQNGYVLPKGVEKVV